MGALLAVVSPEMSGSSRAAMARELVVHPGETLHTWVDAEAGVALHVAAWEGEPGVLVEPDLVLVADADLATARGLVEAYRARGHACARGLAEAAAFALWDRGRERLVIGTDVLSRHPLAFVQQGRSFVASTRALAILRHPKVELRWSAAYLLHALGDVAAARDGATAFVGVERLPPGAAAVFERGRFSLSQVDALEPRPGADSEALWSLLGDGVRGVGPACVSLSGGVDSACIARACLLEGAGPLRAFSFVPRAGVGSGERARLDAMTRAFPRIELAFVEPSAPSVEVPVPLPDDPCLLAPGFEAARHTLAERAALDGYRVLFDGEGADELFDLAVSWSDLLTPASLPEAGRQLHHAPRPGALLWRQGIVPRLPPVLRPWWLARQAKKPSAAPWLRATPELRAALAEQASQVFLPRYDQRLALFVAGTWSLAARHADRQAARAAGIERRSPFLRRALVELALGLPAAARTGSPGEKRFLRAAARGLLPAAVPEGPKEVAFHDSLLTHALDRADLSVLDWAERHALLAHLIDIPRVRQGVSPAASAGGTLVASALERSRLFWLLRGISWVRAVETGYRGTLSGAQHECQTPSRVP